MKGGLLTLLYGLGAILDGATIPFERLTVIANPDEEIGSPASTPHVRRVAAESDVAFVLECARANGDIVSARKGVVEYVVDDHRPRGTCRGRARRRGAARSSRRPTRVIGLHALTGRWPGVTCNVGVVEAGTRSNVVAGRAVLQVDMRRPIGPASRPRPPRSEALAVAPTVPTWTWRSLSAIATGRWRSCRARRFSSRMPGSLRGGWASRFAMPRRAARPDANTTAGMGVSHARRAWVRSGGLDHSPDEWLDAASIVPRTALFAALLLATGRDPEVATWRASALR